MPNGIHVPAGTAASRQRMAQWKSDIRHEARKAMGERPTMEGGIRLMVEFMMPVPTSSMRKYQYGWLPHTKKPDVDKLFRMLGDALTGIVWRDDSQVCISNINKVYAWDGVTGASVVVEELTEEYCKRFASAADTLRKVIRDDIA